MSLIITKNDLISVEKELCGRSLHQFTKRAWHVYNWHMGAICEHLEAVTNGEIRRLLINVPPGTSKSSLVSIYWTAWEWGPKSMPHIRFIGASHEQGLAVRDTRKMRNLVNSEWYQSRWPIVFSGDQNQKTFFENESTGFRQACAISSMTGRRGDRVAIDDPHSATGALSDVIRESALTEFKETIPSRLNNPDSSAIIVIMQRLHEGDIANECEEQGYVKLCLPMEFEVSRRCTTSIGFSDPRTKEGELLFPARFPQNVVDEYKRSLGSYAYASQMQQRPAPRSGGFFVWENLQVVQSAPKFTKRVRYWDKAGSEGAGCFTAGVGMGLAEDGLWYVDHVVRGQWAAPERERVIRQTAEMDGYDTEVWIEQEPGSGGKESAEATIRNLAGFNVYAERPTGEKSVRAEPYSVQVEANNIRIVSGDWTKEFIDEHKNFPAGKYKDQIDAASGAFNKLAEPSSFGILIKSRHR
jgi:predicted phage terminase large subunit-like protein